MEQLKQMKEMLTGCVQGQLSHLDKVDAQELGAAVDMIKDLSEAIYYCTITEAMEAKEDKYEGRKETMYYPVMYYREKDNTDWRDDGRRYYIGNMPYPYYSEDDYYRDMDKMKGRMYYNGSSSSNGNGNSTSNGGGSFTNGTGTRYYSEREMPFGEMMRDHREGKSPHSRKTYMESKEMHKDKASQLQELEKYVQELTADMVEMIEGASPEEKQLLSNRIATLATKIK